MTTALDVLIWIAEHADWWWLLLLAPGVAGWAWLELRPTGKHRRPGSSSPGRPAEAAAPTGEDTIVFQRVVYRSGETDG
ncbi:hypothetical protein ABT301_29330 [Streptomyces sp. NPDC000987]|uniref:hypothetical protein n=1 Tax=Streptomyces sp. NPDC000987 TaxID=3154374 RepID=UPI0033285727